MDALGSAFGKLAPHGGWNLNFSSRSLRFPPPPSRQSCAMANVDISLPLPVLPEGWAGEKDFKAIGQLSEANDRNIEPVGPHFLAYARRVC